MTDVAAELMQLAGGDPFAQIKNLSDKHQQSHGCSLYTAGPSVMQLASAFVKTANAMNVLDLGCGIGYSTLWLADAVGS